MFAVTVGPYRLICNAHQLPELYHLYLPHAQLTDEIDLHLKDGAICFVAIQHGRAWPFLIVAQRYSPAGFGQHPGVVVIPETDRLFIAAGTRLLAYDLRDPQRLWEDRLPTAFLNWLRFEDMMLLSAENHLAAWDINGEKRWSTDVESPWKYTVNERTVELESGGKRTRFDIRTGPDKRPA